MFISVEDGWKNIQQRNVLKGISMQKAISQILLDNGYSTTRDETTIIKCLKILNDNYKLPQYSFYKTKKKFKLNSEEFLKTKYIPEIKFKDKLNYISFFLKPKLNNKIAKRCNYCGLDIYIENRRKKCLRCNKGRFSKYAYIKQYNNHNEFFDKNIAIEILQKNKNISKSKTAEKITKKRLDGWFFDGGDLYIFESKNKEKTGIYYREVFQTLTYLMIIETFNPTLFSKIYLIYNGPDLLNEKEFSWIVDFETEKFKEKLYVVNFDDWVKTKNLKINFNTIIPTKRKIKYDYIFTKNKDFSKHDITIVPSNYFWG